MEDRRPTDWFGFTLCAIFVGAVLAVPVIPLVYP